MKNKDHCLSETLNSNPVALERPEVQPRGPAPGCLRRICLYSESDAAIYQAQPRAQGKGFAFRLDCFVNGSEMHQHPTMEQVCHLKDMRYVKWLDESRGIAAYRSPDQGIIYTHKRHGLYSPAGYFTEGQPRPPWLHAPQTTVPAGVELIADFPLYIGEFEGDWQALKWKNQCRAVDNGKGAFHMPAMQMRGGIVRIPSEPIAAQAASPGSRPYISMRRVGECWQIDMRGRLPLPKGPALLADHSITLKSCQALRRIAAIVCEDRSHGFSNPLTIEYGPLANIVDNGRWNFKDDPEEDSGDTRDAIDYGFQNSEGDLLPYSVDNHIFQPLSKGFRKIHGLWPDGPRTGLQLWKAEARRLLIEAEELEKRRDFMNAAPTRNLAQKLKRAANNDSHRGKSKVFHGTFQEVNKLIRESIVELQDELRQSEDEGCRLFGTYLRSCVMPQGILADKKSSWFVSDGFRSSLFEPQALHRLELPDGWHGKGKRVRRRLWPTTLPPTSDEVVFHSYMSWRPPATEQWPYLWSGDVFEHWNKTRCYLRPSRAARPPKTKPGPQHSVVDPLHSLHASRWWNDRMEVSADRRRCYGSGTDIVSSAPDRGGAEGWTAAERAEAEQALNTGEIVWFRPNGCNGIHYVRLPQKTSKVFRPTRSVGSDSSIGAVKDSPMGDSVRTPSSSFFGD